MGCRLAAGPWTTSRAGLRHRRGGVQAATGQGRGGPTAGLPPLAGGCPAHPHTAQHTQKLPGPHKARGSKRVCSSVGQPGQVTPHYTLPGHMHACPTQGRRCVGAAATQQRGTRNTGRHGLPAWAQPPNQVRTATRAAKGGMMTTSHHPLIVSPARHHQGHSHVGADKGAWLFNMQHTRPQVCSSLARTTSA